MTVLVPLLLALAVVFLRPDPLAVNIISCFSFLPLLLFHPNFSVLFRTCFSDTSARPLPAVLTSAALRGLLLTLTICRTT